MAAALCCLGREAGAHIVADGIETRAECQVLAASGVSKDRGNLLGRPLELTAGKAAPGSSRTPAARAICVQRESSERISSSRFSNF